MASTPVSDVCYKPAVWCIVGVSNFGVVADDRQNVAARTTTPPRSSQFCTIPPVQACAPRPIYLSACDLHSKVIHALLDA